MIGFLQLMSQLVWGVPALAAVLGVGGYLTIKTHFAQLRLLPNAFHLFITRILQNESNNDGITPYQAFCTALGATVGTGNIAGVAGAIAIGGPGAVFWMWVSAFLGMITKYAEALLAVHYQDIDRQNRAFAGPMYIIRNGMGQRWKPLAYIYAILGVIASFGVGNSVQINAVMYSIKSLASTYGGSISDKWIYLIAAIAALVTYVMLIGGAKRIASTAEALVPVVSAGYMLLCVVVLAARCHAIDDALSMIVCGALSPQAVTGGVVGSAMRTIRIGTSRGVFTNEAGLGTAGIAHGSAKTKHPAQQGVLGIVEVFLDTIVICTLTALVILCSGVPIEYGSDCGAELTISGFSSVIGEWVTIPLAIIMICLAIATVLGWGLYGIRCANFLFGDKVLKSFALLQALAAFCGGIMETPVIWLWAEILNGLMLLPNLIAIIHRSKVVTSLTESYQKTIKLERKTRCDQRRILLK